MSGEPPDREAAARIARFAAWFRASAGSVWHVETPAGHLPLTPNPFLVDRSPSMRARYETTVAALRATWTDDDLTAACGETCAFPAATGLQPSGSDQTARAWLLQQAAWTTAAVWTAEHPTERAAELIARRTRYIVEHVFEGTERPVLHFVEHGYDLPALRECLALLQNLGVTATARDAMLGLVRLEHDVPITPPADEAFRRSASSAWGSDVHGADLIRSYQPYYSTLSWAFRGFYDVLARQGRLDAETLERAVRRLPLSFPDSCLRARGRDPGDAPPGELRDMVRDLLWRAAQRMDDDDVRMIEGFRVQLRPEGARWLVQACALIEREGLDVVPGREFRGRLRVIREIAGIGDTAESDDPAEVVSALRHFRPATLQAALPIAGAGQVLVLQALGWDRACTLLALLLEIRNTSFATATGMPHGDAPNCADPASGVVDPAAVCAAVEEAGQETARSLLTAFQRAEHGFDHTIILIEAALGWNRESILDKVERDSQIALKAVGLLPIERGRDEVMERYLRLQAAHKDAGVYGPERTVNTRAAAEAGLANLAAVAGYADASRLEWAMESRVAATVVPLGVSRPAGPWTVELALDGLTPRLVVRRGGRPLASVPSGLRRLSEYGAMKDAATQLKSQVGRFRRAFEASMVGEEGLGRDERRDLFKVPAAGELLRRLVLRNQEGRSGTLDGDSDHLCGYDGEMTDAGDVVTVAHPYHLLREGTLGAWQRTLVERRVVQPFKQAFRELYFPTPAERETAAWSERFAGHVLDSRVGTRLFLARGWRMAAGETARPFKSHRAAGLSAWFAFADAGHFLGETPTITSGSIAFRRLKVTTPEADVPLTEVPPIVFSETMRDADLVVSVAGGVDTAFWSYESCERRAELLRVIAAVLGLEQVKTEGLFAQVRGTRARYRIHLGSGAVQMEPGGIALIVPDRVDGAEPVYLPFADEDPRTLDVLAKVMMLADDDRITDEVVLAQIRAGGS